MKDKILSNKNVFTNGEATVTTKSTVTLNNEYSNNTQYICIYSPAVMGVQYD